MTTRIHLDTDIGGDPDDLVALAMLLGDDSVEIAGITTNADAEGKRASMTRHVLRLAGRDDIPVATGARGFMGGLPHFPRVQDERSWPGVAFEPPGPASEAIELLAANIAAGCEVIAIGPLTNLALIEVLRPGILATARLTVMGGYTGYPAPGLPQWGPEMDWNIQCDRVAADIVFEAGNPLIAPLNVCFGVPLRATSLPTLDAGGPVSRLIALQARVNGERGTWAKVSREHPGIPGDTLNIQWDPVATAAALGWDCARAEAHPLAFVASRDLRYFVRDASAKVRRVLTSVDVEAFTARWEALVTRV